MSENPAWWSALADSQQSSGSWLHQKKPLSIMQTLPIITRFNHRLCLQHRFYDWPYQLCNYISCYKTIQLMIVQWSIHSEPTSHVFILFLPVFNHIWVYTGKYYLHSMYGTWWPNSFHCQQPTLNKPRQTQPAGTFVNSFSGP